MITIRQFRRLSLALVVQSAVLYVVSLGAAENVPIVTFDATSAADSADPELQGWTKQNDRPLQASFRSVGQGAERAWRIDVTVTAAAALIAATMNSSPLSRRAE